MSFRYFNNCVNWNRDDVHKEGGLCDMVDSGRDITRRTFIKNVGLPEVREFEKSMGYPFGGLTMAADYAVAYYRGKLHGERVYWVKHSAIEYVFTRI